MSTSRFHVRALDGLRGLAVLLVLAYHFEFVSWLHGGWLGVELFFVLSGFLITHGLVQERQRFGDISLRAFYVRRALRLFPALYVWVAVLALFVWAVGTPEEVRQVQRGALVSILYVANWAKALRWGNFSPMHHAWSLSIEEQFYFAWPLVLIACYAWGGLRRVRHAALAITALLLVWRLGMAVGPAPNTRLYHGADTRAPGLLFGCLAALYLPARLPDRWRPGMRWVGGLSLAAFLATSVGMGKSIPIYVVGLPIVDLTAAVVILSLVLASESRTARAFSWAPLVWFGTVSYGLYLWHWSVIVLLPPERLGLPTGWAKVVQLALSLAITAASYRWIERPALAWKDRLGGVRTAPVPALAPAATPIAVE